MSKSTPSSVTAEEAVARMVNMDYIPEGFTLEDMLAAFEEEAEVELENAKIDRLPDTQIESLKVRMEACEARRSLALLLLKDFRDEVRKPHDSAIFLSQESSGIPRYTLESIADWVSYKYGIGIPEWIYNVVHPATSGGLPIDANWEDIEIRIRKDNKIAYSHTKGKWTQKTFGEIGLLDRKTQNPNQQAGVLIGLNIGKKFPPSKTAEAKHKTTISKLRTALKDLTGIESDPFIRFNETDGWKPRFKLTDDRRNDDNRAKMAALHKEYDDEKNYDDENDDAGKYLKDNQ